MSNPINSFSADGVCADKKAHEWSMYIRAKESMKSVVIIRSDIRSDRAATAQARKRLLRWHRVTAAVANRVHATRAFVAGPLYKESSIAIVAATAWYRV
jgi:hypothetical protein